MKKKIPVEISPAAVASSTQERRVAPIVPEVVEERFQSLPFESQQIGGLLSDRMRINVEGRLLHVDEDALLSGFTDRDSNGDPEGAWLGEHAGKFLDASCNALRYHDNPELRRLMDRIAKTLISSQAPDGYLGTYTADRRWTSWDVWVHKYNLIGLLSYHELTGDPTALAACRKVGDLLDRTFGETHGQRDIVSAGYHMGMAATSILEPMCGLYRFTAEPRYLEFSKYIVRAYDHAHGPRIVSSLLDHGSVFRTANGKAYEMLSNFNGLIDLYRLTADEKLLTAVLCAWDDIVRHQLYVTGALSALEHFQPIGRLLSLQSSNVGEMCVSVTWLQINWRLLRLTGEARFGQEIERTVYNQLLAAQDPRSGNLCYYTSLVGSKEFTDKVLCCVSSGPRGISLIPKLVWGLGKDTFVVNLYTSGRASFEVGGVPVQVLSDTRFPLDGNITLTVNPDRAVPFTMRLRVPEWATHFEVNTGSKTLTGRAGQMLDITQTWPQSTVLKIWMNLPTRALRGAPMYADYVALQRGPQVLALERAVNQTVPCLHRVALVDSPDAATTRPVAAPTGWSGDQVYEAKALAGIPWTTDQMRLEKRDLLLVPFADAVDYRVWVTRGDRVRCDLPAVTAFVRAGLSVGNENLHFEPTDAGRVDTSIAEFLTDESPETLCNVDPRRDAELASILGASVGRRGDPVWFWVWLDAPETISRVVFRHGKVSSIGGWFDTSEVKPHIEVARSPVPLRGGICFLPDMEKAAWERAAAIDLYPTTSASLPPELPDGQPFEVRLPQPLTVYAIRVVGRPGGDFASCAELSAYI